MALGDKWRVHELLRAKQHRTGEIGIASCIPARLLQAASLQAEFGRLGCRSGSVTDACYRVSDDVVQLHSALNVRIVYSIHLATKTTCVKFSPS